MDQLYSSYSSLSFSGISLFAAVTQKLAVTNTKAAPLAASKEALEETRDHILSIFPNIANSSRVENTQPGPRRRQGGRVSTLGREKRHTRSLRSDLASGGEFGAATGNKDEQSDAITVRTHSIAVERDSNTRDEGMHASKASTVCTAPLQTNTSTSRRIKGRGSHWQTKRVKKLRLQANAAKAREAKRKILVKRRFEKTLQDELMDFGGVC